MNACDALASRKQLGRFMFVVTVIAITLILVLLMDNKNKRTRASQVRFHDDVMATTVDASGGTGLVRLQQQVTRTPDGACTITVQRYERNSTNDLFLRQPIIETLPCSGT